MRFTAKSIADVVFRDVTSFGALPFFLFVLALVFALDEVTFALRLFGFLLLAYAIVATIRFLHFKPRPKKEAYSNVFEKIDSSSFPSLHAVRATGLGLFFMESFGSLYVTFLLFVFVFLICVSRLYLQKHDLWDVLAGVALGIVLFFVF